MSHKKAIEFFSNPRNSKLQEQFAEYSFLKELLLESALKSKIVAVSRGDYDGFGYDLVLEYDGILKKVQLKAKSGKKTGYWDIHKSILGAENGCVILVVYDLNGNNEIQTRFRIFNPSMKTIALERKPKGRENSEGRVLKSKVIFTDFIEIKKGELLERIFEITTQLK